MEENKTFIKTEYAKELSNYKLPRYDELPEFNLYMEQLIELLDKYLAIFRTPGEEKPMTATMINNYVKQKVIPAPKNKKYSKLQLAHLLVVGVLKEVLSLSEIKQVLELQTIQYTTDIAYNYFCKELEVALKATFITRDFSQKNSASKITPLSEAARSALIAFTNKIYAKQSLFYKRNNV